MDSCLQGEVQVSPEGWELVMTKLISEWEIRIGDQNYHPYKMLKLDPQGDKMKVKTKPIISFCLF